MLTIREPWESENALDRELVRLLARIGDEGPIARDGLNRHCLQIQELIPLLPNSARLTQRYDDMAGLVASLSAASERDDGHDPSAHAWNMSLERLRRRVNWLHFSQAQRRRAERRARFLTRQAQQRQWIQYIPDDDLWLITPAGVAALEIHRMSRMI